VTRGRNGHTIRYDSGSSPELGAKTYTLAGGGTLTPARDPAPVIITG